MLEKLKNLQEVFATWSKDIYDYFMQVSSAFSSIELWHISNRTVNAWL